MPKPAVAPRRTPAACLIATLVYGVLIGAAGELDAAGQAQYIKPALSLAVCHWCCLCRAQQVQLGTHEMIYPAT
jgi:hypothetical protein